MLGFGRWRVAQYVKRTTAPGLPGQRTTYQLNVLARRYVRRSTAEAIMELQNAYDVLANHVSKTPSELTNYGAWRLMKQSALDAERHNGVRVCVGWEAWR